MSTGPVKVILGGSKTGKTEHPSVCPTCQDRGYTVFIPKFGILNPCPDCAKGKRVEEQFDTVTQNARTCRLLSRQGVRG